ncbi:hypothetical protein KSP39_PZI023428 [Platanthera zijinensis]|uniref:Small auxin up regulated protein n=1 Tax=Platanthera zijinensis TaxID=2320716 RepID=A0AAP0FTA1_9ASPA
MDRSRSVISDKTISPKGLISKTLQRCRSLNWISGRRDANSPVGWISVRVGPEKEKFLVRAEWMNHHLFRRLLDEAETEYGYAADGPLEFPCSVRLFHMVLWEMEQDAADAALAAFPAVCGCVSPGTPGSRRGRSTGYRLLSPSRVAAVSRF